MCGIAGAIDHDEGRAAARVKLLNEAQRHRGPDDTVVTRVGGYTLGNTRLAIQDPGPAGNQPFTSADGRYHCVFNGEIYNHRELAERYRLPVRTHCDGEVIPWLWAKLGTDCAAELRGMFAIALVDSAADRLYLLRDPFGIKPLYWRVLGDGTLIFGSEVLPLVQAARGVSIDSAAVARFLRFGAMAPGQAPFSEIKALAPNTVAAFGPGVQPTLWPVLPGGPLAQTRPQAGLGPALMTSIDLHLGADVPTALLLSAGVDSAAIAAAGRHLGRDLHCLTVATRGSADESGAAAKTAAHYGHRFQRVPARLEDGDVAAFLGGMQRPTIDGLNTYLVCKAVHEAGFKVVLSGLGGDEAVGGYGHFRLLKYLPALRALHALPGPVTSGLAKALALTGVAGAAKGSRLLGRDGPRDGADLCLLHREVLGASLAAGLTGAGDRRPAEDFPRPVPGDFGAMVAAEVATYLQSTLLPDADTFSMMSSVELRVPFVDTQVFGAVLGRTGRPEAVPGKAAMGRALGDGYLRELASQPKRGFSVPMRHWLTGPLRPVLSAADDRDAAVWSVLDRARAQRAGILPLRAGSRWSEAWAIAVLNAWLEKIKSGSAQR